MQDNGNDDDDGNSQAQHIAGEHAGSHSEECNAAMIAENQHQQEEENDEMENESAAGSITSEESMSDESHDEIDVLEGEVAFNDKSNSAIDDESDTDDEIDDDEYDDDPFPEDAEDLNANLHQATYNIERNDFGLPVHIVEGVTTRDIFLLDLASKVKKKAPYNHVI